jgi:hypothetical protein
MNMGSDRPQSLSGGLAGGADSWQQPRKRADKQSGGEPADPSFGRDYGGFAVATGVGGRGGRA